MKRTNNTDFLPCPICNKLPKVNLYNLNYASAFCRGEFFRPHRDICADTDYMQPSKLVNGIIDKWNVVVTNENLIYQKENKSYDK